MKQEEQEVEEVLKKALLLERRGKVFYERVAREASGPAVRRLFEMLAEEEARHVEHLSRQFASYAATGSFQAVDSAEESGSVVSQVLSEEIRRQISAADYEAAAISAAIEMENRAVEVYSRRAEASADKAEKELYRWLADWERGHLRLLAGINDELIEEVWNDNGFWPF